MYCIEYRKQHVTDDDLEAEWPEFKYYYTNSKKLACAYVNKRIAESKRRVENTKGKLIITNEDNVKNGEYAYIQYVKAEDFKDNEYDCPYVKESLEVLPATEIVNGPNGPIVKK